MAEQEKRAGFEIDGRFYPVPSSFRFGDPILVTELTGLSWEAFVEGLPADDELEGEEPDMDPVILAGLVAVAVWQGNPRWSRRKVVEYMERLDLQSLAAQGGDDGPPELTPAPEAPGLSSPASAETPSASLDAA